MGLIAWYPLDGDARDAVGGRHGEVVGNVDWTDGKLGKAVSTTYNKDYIRVPHDPELSAKIFGVVPKVTLAAWVKLRSYNNYGLIVGKNSGGSYSNTTNAIWVNNSEVRFVVGSNEPSNPSGSTAYAHARSFTLNTWHHIAAVLDGDWMGIYVDGVLVDSGSSVLARERSENTADMVIGGPRSGGNEGVDGEIQDVRIYDHALSPREVRDLSLGLARRYSFEGDDLLDYAGGKIVRPSAPVPSIVGAGPSGLPAYQFDGSTQYLDTEDTIPFIRGDAAFSLTAWVWIDSDHGSGTSGGSIIGHAGSTGFGMQVNGRRINFGYRGTGNFSGTTNLDLGRWYHVSCVREKGGDCRVYLNGDLDGSGANTLIVNDTTRPVQIGYSAGRVSYLHGRLSDVRIYATALTPAQAKELYQQKASIDSEGSVHAVSGEVIAGAGVVGLEHHGVRSEDGAWFTNDSYATYEDVSGDLQVQELSVSAWINIDNPSSWRPILLLGEILNSPSDPRNWGHAAYTIWMNNSGLEVMLRGSSYRSPLTNVPNSRWVQVGFTYDGERVKVFIDGAKVSDEAYSGGIDYAGGDRRILQLGGRNSYSWFQGGIRDVAIVGRAVSEQEMATGLDGTTSDLLAWLPMRDDTATINSRGRLGKSVSEVGITRGLVAWYPLISDTKDYAGTNHAVNNGAVLTAEGYAFESSAYLQATAPVLPSSGDGVEASISAWIMPRNFSGEGWIVSQYASGGALRFIWNTTSSGRMRYFIGGSSITGTSTLVTNTWVHVCVTRKADGTIDLFLNGQPDGSGTLTNLYADTPLTIGNSAGGSGASLTIRDIRIHDVALTPEEVATQAKLALNQTTKSAMTQSCLYTNGQIKEVIA